jgi:hypothetical protein
VAQLYYRTGAPRVALRSLGSRPNPSDPLLHETREDLLPWPTSLTIIVTEADCIELQLAIVDTAKPAGRQLLQHKCNATCLVSEMAMLIKLALMPSLQALHPAYLYNISGLHALTGQAVYLGIFHTLLKLNLLIVPIYSLATPVWMMHLTKADLPCQLSWQAVLVSFGNDVCGIGPRPLCMILQRSSADPHYIAWLDGRQVQRSFLQI